MPLSNTNNKIDIYTKEYECELNGKRYKVRDNGAVCRLPENDGRKRYLDNKWTFGKLGRQGYLFFRNERVHRIVALAVYGQPPMPNMVVDHLDTNRQNNRPENLKWVTPLENILDNPITRKRIIQICGSIENFLKDPSQLKGTDVIKNYNWMRPVSPEEAKVCKDNLMQWAKLDNYKSENNKKGNLGEWIYHHNSDFDLLKYILSQIPFIKKENIGDWKKIGYLSNVIPTTKDIFIQISFIMSKQFQLDIMGYREISEGEINAIKEHLIEAHIDGINIDLNDTLNISDITKNNSYRYVIRGRIT